MYSVLIICLLSDVLISFFFWLPWQRGVCVCYYYYYIQFLVKWILLGRGVRSIMMPAGCRKDLEISDAHSKLFLDKLQSILNYLVRAKDLWNQWLSVGCPRFALIIVRIIAAKKKKKKVTVLSCICFATLHESTGLVVILFYMRKKESRENKMNFGFHIHGEAHFDLLKNLFYACFHVRRCKPSEASVFRQNNG